MSSTLEEAMRDEIEREHQDDMLFRDLIEALNYLFESELNDRQIEMMLENDMMTRETIEKITKGKWSEL